MLFCPGLVEQTTYKLEVMLASKLSKEAHNKSIAKLQQVIANGQKWALPNKGDTTAIARLLEKKVNART